MPRKARIGALHHIICRGIERKEILKDDIDRNNFVDRLGSILVETKTPCFAWALIPNHFHLLLKTANVPPRIIDIVLIKLKRYLEHACEQSCKS